MSKLIAPRTSVPSLGTHADGLSRPPVLQAGLSSHRHGAFGVETHGTPTSNELTQFLPGRRSSAPGAKLADFQKVASKQRHSSPHVTALLDGRALRIAGQTDAGSQAQLPEALFSPALVSPASTPRSAWSQAPSSAPSLARPPLSNSNPSLDGHLTTQSAVARAGRGVGPGRAPLAVPTLPLPLSTSGDGNNALSSTPAGFIYEWHAHQLKPLKTELDERRKAAGASPDDWNDGLSVQDNQKKDVDLRCALFEIQFPITVVFPKRAARRASVALAAERDQLRRESHAPVHADHHRVSVRSVVSRQSNIPLKSEAIVAHGRRDSLTSEAVRGVRDEEGLQESGSAPSSVKNAEDLEERSIPAMHNTARSAGSAATTLEPSYNASHGQGSNQGKIPAGLGGALSSFGSPNEWWHDSIILGRLSAVAMRYFAMRAMRRPWTSWLEQVERSRQKRKLQALQRTGVALRVWRWRHVAYGKRMKNKVPLVRALTRIPLIALLPAWERLRQAIFFRRDLERRKRVLLLIERKMFDTLAKAHYYQNLLRLGFATFWMAARVPPYNKLRKGHEVSHPVDDTGGHVRQVIRRVWRRWYFSAKMWLSSSEYQERVTEAWLVGECGTPRTIVTSTMPADASAPVASAESTQKPQARPTPRSVWGWGHDAESPPPWGQQQEYDEEGLVVNSSLEVPFPDAAQPNWGSSPASVENWMPQRIAEDGSPVHMEMGRIQACGSPRKRQGPVGLLQPFADADERRRASHEGANKFSGNPRAPLAPFGPRHQAVLAEEPREGSTARRARRRSSGGATLQGDAEDPSSAHTYWDDAEFHNGVGDAGDGEDAGFVLGDGAHSDRAKTGNAKNARSGRSLTGAVSPEARDYWQMRCQIGQVSNARPVNLHKRT